MPEATTEFGLAIVVLDDGQEMLVAFDPDQPRGPDGRWKKIGFGQLNLPGFTPLTSPSTEKKKTISDKLATMKLKRGTLEALGGGISSTYTAELEDGTPVMIKEPLGGGLLIRDNLDQTNGNSHAKAATRIADYLGVATPRVEKRTAKSLGVVLPSDEVQVQEWLPDFETIDENEGPPTREEAARFAILDDVIGNTDRHDGNLGFNDGELTAIDNDLSFPTDNASLRGNYVEWTDAWGNAIAGTPIDDKIQKLLEDMERNHGDWSKKLKQDGLTDKELQTMWERIETLNEYGEMPYFRGSPWEHYYEEDDPRERRSHGNLGVKIGE